MTMTRPTATIETNHGTIELELHADLAPQTVQNFGTLAQDGFYEGQKFHRVIDRFMIQGGDPLTKDDSNKRRWGSGGPGYTIPDEFACDDGTIVNKHPGSYNRKADQCEANGGFHKDARMSEPGVLAMANTGSGHTGGSQFFITLSEQDRLTGYHTVFGNVTNGMDVVKKIGQVSTDGKDRPKKNVVIEDITIQGDLPDVTVNKQKN